MFLLTCLRVTKESLNIETLMVAEQIKSAGEYSITWSKALKWVSSLQFRFYFQIHDISVILYTFKGILCMICRLLSANTQVKVQFTVLGKDVFLVSPLGRQTLVPWVARLPTHSISLWQPTETQQSINLSPEQLPNRSLPKTAMSFENTGRWQSHASSEL